MEHPVTEEITGIDLVREQFRLARGEELGYTDPPSRGHSIEFRINGEDAGRSFMPSPGSIEKLRVPAGPGVRWDSGVVEGDTVGGSFDSMLAKLIVTGADRSQALARARRALAELSIEGMPTVINFHRTVLTEPAFTAADGNFTVHTRWIETEFNNSIAPYNGGIKALDEEDEQGQSFVVEVNGKRMEILLPQLPALTTTAKPASKKRKERNLRTSSNSSQELTSPMQGTIVKVEVKDGAKVAEGDLIVVLEAMKMEQPITAHRSGKVSGLKLKAGDTVAAGATIASIK